MQLTVKNYDIKGKRINVLKKPNISGLQVVVSFIAIAKYLLLSPRPSLVWLIVVRSVSLSVTPPD